VERGHGNWTAQFNDNVREYFSLVGDEVREKLLEILNEVPPETYDPPTRTQRTAGLPFHFSSRALGREIFFKFQI